MTIADPAKGENPMSEDRCICCGEIVPEGRMVCPNCEKPKKPRKCNYPEESDYCAFHYNGICTREHNYECPALAMKNLSHGEMVQIAEGKKNKTPRYIDANKLIDLATHEGAYGYVDVHDIYNAPTADVVERKKGKWILSDEQWQEDVDNGNYRFICSECGKSDLHSKEVTVSFCWNCGAEMEKTDG